MEERILRDGEGNLVRAKVDENGQIVETIEVLESAGDAQRSAGRTAPAPLVGHPGMRLLGDGQGGGRHSADTPLDLGYELAQLLEAGARAWPHVERETPGHPERVQRVPQRAAAMRAFRLDDFAPLPALRAGQAIHAPAFGARSAAENLGPELTPAQRREAGRVLTLRETLLEQSLAFRLGTTLIPLPMGEEAFPLRGRGRDGVTIGLGEHPGEFSTVEAASFSEQASEGAEWSVSAVPASRLEIKRDDLRIFGWSTEVTRREMSERGRRVVGEEIALGIVHGLAKLADHLLFDELDPGAMTDFAPGLAASAGLHWNELRAIIGTAGTGALTERGDLYVSAGQDFAVPAAFTGEIAESIVGAWGRTAIAFADEISVVVDRHNLAGNLSVTAFLGAKGLIPDASKFWTIGAA